MGEGVHQGVERVMAQCFDTVEVKRWKTDVVSHFLKDVFVQQSSVVIGRGMLRSSADSAARINIRSAWF